MVSLTARMKANVKVTAEKFERENGKRHRRLEELRGVSFHLFYFREEFQRLYKEEAKWLEDNRIEWSPSWRGWISRNIISFEEMTQEEFVSLCKGEGLAARVAEPMRALLSREVLSVYQVRAVHKRLAKLGYVAVDVSNPECVVPVKAA